MLPDFLLIGAVSRYSIEEYTSLISVYFYACLIKFIFANHLLE